MRRAALFVILLLNAAADAKDAAGEPIGPAAESREAKEAEGEESAPTGNSRTPGFVGKLLVVPMDGSHWVGMKAIVQELGRRGHQVTVVIPEVSIRMGPGDHYQTLTHPVPYDKSLIDTIMSANKNIVDVSEQSFFEKMKKRFGQFQKIASFLHTGAESLLFNSSLIAHLGQQNFDAMFTDPMVPTGSLIAHKLGLPTINLLRGIPCSLDMKAAGCPSPPSYVPRFFTGYTPRMNFKERVINTLVALLEPLFCRILYWRFDQIAQQFLGEEVGVAEVLSESDLWLMRLDFTFEFPRPLMPNMVLVGGINCGVRKPLPEDLESWVSGEHGFVVFTLGTMVSELPEETTTVFLEAFRQIPQKVIWRFTGPVPDKVPDNVKIMSWVPQNDLLAHPGARAFITHAGSHGLYEGLCHGVPMLMLPLNGDQPDNAHRLASRDVGIVRDINTVTTESLLQGLKELITDAKYKANIQKLSELHRDRPVDPLDLSVYWIEFVMRHKGATHLKAAVRRLNWVEYFCLDVLALLAAVVLVSVMLAVKCMKLCLRKLRGKRKRE